MPNTPSVLSVEMIRSVKNIQKCHLTSVRFLGGFSALPGLALRYLVPPDMNKVLHAANIIEAHQNEFSSGFKLKEKKRGPRKQF